MVGYTHQAYFILANGGTVRREVLMVDRLCKKRQLLQGSVCDLKLQRDMYLQKVNRASISLIEIGFALSNFEFSSSLINQVKLVT